MTKKKYLLTAPLIVLSATQFAAFTPQAFAQVEAKRISDFGLDSKMEINSRFNFAELEVNQQQKDAWSNELFNDDTSITMKLENLQTIRLSEEELKNNDYDDGIEVISF
ncbi:MAG: hypothetical protein AAFR62_10170 [Cyanobacteria bacterium J06629_2]